MTHTFSSHQLDMATCARRLWYYRVARRRSAEPRPGADAGSATHAGFAAWNRGEPVEAQEAAIKAVRDARLMQDDDYRTTPYLLDAFAQLRAVLAPVFDGWKRLEVEKRGFTELGQWGGEVFQWEYVRDAVVQSPDGDIWVVDLKTASRADSADVAAWANSGQFKSYLWAWNVEHPEAPAAGIWPIRLIMRKPSRTGVPYEVPQDPPIRFTPEALAEWQTGAMRRCADIVKRDPERLDDWPMSDSTAGTCRNQWGCCDYIGVCTMPRGDRALKLATDQFEPADAGKENPNA